MSKLAQKIATVRPADLPPRQTWRRGPVNQCYRLYGAGDLEDWEAIEVLRQGSLEARPLQWREVQREVDKGLGITRPLQIDKFRYHWKRKCYCWPEDLRL